MGRARSGAEGRRLLSHLVSQGGVPQGVGDRAHVLVTPVLGLPGPSGAALAARDLDAGGRRASGRVAAPRARARAGLRRSGLLAVDGGAWGAEGAALRARAGNRPWVASSRRAQPLDQVLHRRWARESVTLHEVDPERL